MKKLLNTLYITNKDYYLLKDGENVVIKMEKKEIKRFPIHILEGIICFNYIGVSPALIRLCSEHNISISYISPSGRFCGRFVGITNGNVLLRREQYRIADENKSLDIAKNIIKGKLINSRKILLKGLKDHKQKINKKKLDKICLDIKNQLMKIDFVDNKDTLRGIEGEVARKYFSGLDELILKNKNIFFMKSRSKRPPLDNFNALISYLYSILMYDVQSALESVGLDSYVGMFHSDRPGRAGLALDMMEELRAYMVDKLAVKLINYGQIKENNFSMKENGSVLLNDSGRSIVLSEWQKRKNVEVEHKYLKEKIKIGLLPYVQALLLSRCIRGDIENYPPFLIK